MNVAKWKPDWKVANTEIHLFDFLERPKEDGKQSLAEVGRWEQRSVVEGLLELNSLLFFFFSSHATYGILVPQPGTEQQCHCPRAIPNGSLLIVKNIPNIRF